MFKYFFVVINSAFEYLRPSNTGNIFVQLVAQHCCKVLLPVLPPPQTTCQTSGFVAKGRTEFYFVQLATLKFVARQVACRVGNTGNKALQLAKQKCCATSCKEMLPVLLDLYRLASSSDLSRVLADQGNDPAIQRTEKLELKIPLVNVCLFLKRTFSVFLSASYPQCSIAGSP